MGKLFEVVGSEGFHTDSDISTRSSKHNRVRDMLAATLVDSLECKVQTEVEILNGRIDVVLEVDSLKFAFEVKTGTSADNINKSRSQCINYYEHGYYPVLVLTVNLLSELNDKEIGIIKDTVIGVSADVLIYDRYFSKLPIFRQVESIIPLLDNPTCYNCGDRMVSFGEYSTCLWCDENTPTVPAVGEDVVDMLRWISSYNDIAEFHTGFNSIKQRSDVIDRQGMDGISKARDRLYGNDS